MPSEDDIRMTVYADADLTLVKKRVAIEAPQIGKEFEQQFSKRAFSTEFANSFGRSLFLIRRIATSSGLEIGQAFSASILSSMSAAIGRGGHQLFYSLGATMATSLFQAGEEFTKITDQLRIMGNLAPEVMNNVKSSILSISTQMGRTQEDVGKSLKLLMQSGYSAEDSITVLNAASRIAKATFSEISPIIEVMSDTLHAFGLKAKDSNIVAASLFETLNKTRYTLPELSKLYGSLGEAAQLMNTSLTEFTAILIGMGQAGVRPTTGLMALQAVLRMMTEPTDEMVQVATRLGIELDTERGGSLIKTLHALAAASLEDQKALVGRAAAVVTLNKAYETIFESLEKYNNESKLSGDLSTAQEAAAKTLTEQTKQLNQELEKTKTILGGYLIPFARSWLSEINAAIAPSNEGVVTNWGAVLNPDISPHPRHRTPVNPEHALSTLTGQSAGYTGIGYVPNLGEQVGPPASLAAQPKGMPGILGNAPWNDPANYVNIKKRMEDWSAEQKKISNKKESADDRLQSEEAKLNAEDERRKREHLHSQLRGVQALIRDELSPGKGEKINRAGLAALKKRYDELLQSLSELGGAETEKQLVSLEQTWEDITKGLPQDMVESLRSKYDELRNRIRSAPGKTQEEVWRLQQEMEELIARGKDPMDLKAKAPHLQNRFSSLFGNFVPQGIMRGQISPTAVDRAYTQRDAILRELREAGRALDKMAQMAAHHPMVPGFGGLPD